MNSKFFYAVIGVAVIGLVYFSIQPSGEDAGNQSAAQQQGGGYDRTRISIVGSSTVYPFVSVAAEAFGKTTEFETPIVESTGTGGGLKLFCSGAGADTPDFSNASRAIKSSEVEECAKNGVSNPLEIKLGFDGIVFANAKGAPKFVLTKSQIFLGLAKQVPQDGKLVDNPYKNWKEIDASLPDEKIEVYGPPPTSGTRDSFVELVMEEACKDLPEFVAAYPDEKVRAKTCHLLREDGAYVDSGENDNIIVQKLVSNPLSLGIFGYSFLEENQGKVQGSTVDGVEPTLENISSGNYGVSRSLFVYVKREHVGKVPGIKEFAMQLVSDASIGMNGSLTKKGLIPLPENERSAVESAVTSGL